MRQTKYLIILLSIFFSASAFSQDGENVVIEDLESWGSLNLKYKINKKWNVGLEQQFRFGNNSSEINDYITELSTKYNFNKQIFGGLAFRYIGQPDRVGEVQDFENYFRFHMDLGAKNDIKRFDLKYRLRYQVKNQIGISKDEGDYANKHWRFKVGLGYDIKKWKLDPEFSTEFFYHSEQGKQNGFDKFRFTLGTNYKIKSFGKIGMFYRMERELRVSYPKTTNIIGLKYTYNAR